MRTALWVSSLAAALLPVPFGVVEASAWVGRPIHASWVYLGLWAIVPLPTLGLVAAGLAGATWLSLLHVRLTRRPRNVPPARLPFLAAGAAVTWIWGRPYLWTIVVVGVAAAALIETWKVVRAIRERTHGVLGRIFLWWLRLTTVAGILAIAYACLLAMLQSPAWTAPEGTDLWVRLLLGLETGRTGGFAVASLLAPLVVLPIQFDLLAPRRPTGR